MTITLNPDQEAWLRERVAKGEFASVEAAAQQLLSERIAEIATDDGIDDLAWAKPFYDEGIAALDRGEFITLEEYKADMAALLASLK